MESIPFDIIEQMVQCFGKSFHYKDTVVSFLINCGIDKSLAIKHKDEPKFKWAKLLLAELSDSDDGKIKQRQILNGLFNLRKLPDNDVPNKDEGLSALRKLKELVQEYNILIKEDKTKSVSRLEINKQKERLIEERAVKLSELKSMFYSGFSDVNRQQSGYLLEDILYKLFTLHEIEYRKPYKTETQQIDGHFKYNGFDYLIEAKWTNSPPTEGIIGEFKRKVDTKLDSTRGFFFTITAPIPTVANTFNGEGAKIILFDGEDLVHILEGRIDLTDVLKVKLDMAAQNGNVYYKISDYLRKK